VVTLRILAVRLPFPAQYRSIEGPILSASTSLSREEANCMRMTPRRGGYPGCRAGPRRPDPINQKEVDSLWSLALEIHQEVKALLEPEETASAPSGGDGWGVWKSTVTN